MNNNPLINDTLLQMKFARVVSQLSERLEISQPRALGIFYRSQTYRYLNEPDYQLHNMSDAYIVDELMDELRERQT